MSWAQLQALARLWLETAEVQAMQQAVTVQRQAAAVQQVAARWLAVQWLAPEWECRQHRWVSRLAARATGCCSLHARIEALDVAIQHMGNLQRCKLSRPWDGYQRSLRESTAERCGEEQSAHYYTLVPCSLSGYG